MKCSLKYLFSLPVIAVVLSSCAYAPTWTAAAVRESQHAKIEPYTVAKNEIPALPNGYTRLYIYRPQSFVGMLGQAIVIVNGKWMGDPENSFNNNLLLPGSVFIVDSPTDVTRVWWYQHGKGEEADKTISLSSKEARSWYLRWGLKFSSGYLETVPEQKGSVEIEPLRFSGYTRMD
jgi:hypothetical protein